MKVLITGAGGFIGKNLTAKLNEIFDDVVIYYYDIETPEEDLDKFAKECDFVYNFAAVHRPKSEDEFDKVNHKFFCGLLDLLKKYNNKCPVLYTSSIQADNGTKYGESKIAAEKALIEYGKEIGNRIVIYRLTNTFGRWATPNHHSVVATFCYNLVNNIELTISNPDIVMNFYYIDDVIESFITQLKGEVQPCSDGIFRLEGNKVYSISLGDLAYKLTYISKCVKEDVAPEFKENIDEKLYITYLSYCK
ncbi:MAG: NAD-dependent epimerase/dehydratase family protein [Clostridia bacterium]|nr:NAD-dependent epimerase/dehydratase family protein [Clostridia bacterium]